MSFENPRKKIAMTLAYGMRAITDQSSKHKSLDRIARMTDLDQGDLRTAISRLTPKERAEMAKAASEMTRVMETVESHIL